MKKVGIAGFAQETHGLWGVPTRYEDFHRQLGDEIISANRGAGNCVSGFIDGETAGGFQLLPILNLQTFPSGSIVEDSYQKLKEEFLESIKKALPLDGLLIDFHGAMRSDLCADCEGELAALVREVVGDIPVVATLDLHANISEVMVESTDALVVYRKNPHTDKRERGAEAASLMAKLLSGAKLEKCHVKLPLVLSPLTTWTGGYPLKAGCDLADSMRAEPEIATIGIAGGYCYSDSDILGVSVLVYQYKGKAPEGSCRKRCESIAKAIWDKRNTARFYGFAPEQAVAKAMVEPEGPIMLADVGDNIGGGTPGDGTELLRILIESNAERAAIVITDKETVALAHETGVGNTAGFVIGGKTDSRHGSPLNLVCRVLRLTDGRYPVDVNSHFGSPFGNEMRMGRCAVLQTGGVTLLVNEDRTPPDGPMQLSSQGVNPEDMQIVVAKSAIAFRGGFGSIPKGIIEVNTPGISTCDLSKLPLTKVAQTHYPFNPDAVWPAGTE